MLHLQQAADETGQVVHFGVDGSGIGLGDEGEPAVEVGGLLELAGAAAVWAGHPHDAVREVESAALLALALVADRPAVLLAVHAVVADDDDHLAFVLGPQLLDLAEGLLDHPLEVLVVDGDGDHRDAEQKKDGEIGSRHERPWGL